MPGTGGPHALDAAVGLVTDLCSSGRTGEAQMILADLPAATASLRGLALAHARRLAGPDDAVLLRTLHNLALTFEEVGRPQEAESLWSEARLIAEREHQLHQGGT